MSFELTVNEAGMLTHVAPASIRKEIEHVLPGAHVRARGSPRLGFAEVLYLRVLALLGLALEVGDRRQLFEKISKALDRPSVPERIPLGAVADLRLREVADDVRSRWEQFARWKATLVQRDDVLGGEPVFPGTRLSVRMIGAAIACADRDAMRELREDHPNLTDEDIAMAPLYAFAYPRRGRPREAPAR